MEGIGSDTEPCGPGPDENLADLLVHRPCVHRTWARQARNWMGQVTDYMLRVDSELQTP